ncbi:MAG: ATP-binding protein [Desulfomonilia bacterium]|jgi:PAS domain S-box-containing protein
MQNKPFNNELQERTKDLNAGQESEKVQTFDECHGCRIFERSEKSFRTLVENSPTCICIVQNERVVYRNPEQERIFGPLGKGNPPSIYERIHPDDREELSLMIQSTLSGRAPSMGVNIRFIHVSGETTGKLAMKRFHCRSSLIDYEGGPAVLMNLMDITKVTEIERLLCVKDRMASLGHVTAGIAHEIRNPLSGINIYLDAAFQALEDGYNPEGLRDILEKIRSSSSKIESVIKRVMDFSKPSEARLRLIEINKPIEDALSLSSVMLRKSGIRIVARLSEGLPPCMADPQLIEQVILNLVTNAAEALQGVEGKKEIMISSFSNNRGIVVSIADSGPGVPPSMARKVFDPFITTKENSTGIGLSLCQRIINDHGGVLRLSSSKVLGGAQFSFTIPLETY